MQVDVDEHQRGAAAAEEIKGERVGASRETASTGTGDRVTG